MTISKEAQAYNSESNSFKNSDKIMMIGLSFNSRPNTPQRDFS